MHNAFIYRNLHKGKWSIRSLDRDDTYGRVIGHASILLMLDCSFTVSEAGRQRVLREKQKNVHAGVRGMISGVVGSVTPLIADRTDHWLTHKRRYPQLASGWSGVDTIMTNRTLQKGKSITYNPYLFETFMANGRSIHEAGIVFFDKDGKVYARTEKLRLAA